MKKDQIDQTQIKQEIINKIIKSVKSKVSDSLRDSAEIFVRTYYANVALDDLTEMSLEFLVESVVTLWEFCLHRTLGQAKIRICNEKVEVKGHSFFQLVIEIVNDDMPFIVDSITGVINHLGYSTHLVIHPVMRIERDENNTLQNIFPHTPEESRGHDESIVHYEILGSFSSEKLVVLEHEISRALQDTRTAVEDWANMREQLTATMEELKKNSPLTPQESLDFLEWVSDNHFTFLGFCEYALTPGKTTLKNALTPKKGLGVLRDPARQEITHIFKGIKLSPINRQYIFDSEPLLITKTSEVSLVHRHSTMDSLTLKKLDQEGNLIGFYQFVGLFTSAAYNKSVFDIPLLRKKVSNILKRSGFSEQWHDGKALIHILESFPRDEMFQASEDWLFKTCIGILQLQNRQRLTLFIREDQFERFFSCLVYVPRDRYDSALRQKISDILERALQSKVTEWQTQFGELAFARIYLTLSFLEENIPAYDLKAIENELIEASLTWRDHLYQALFSLFGEKKGSQLFEKYGNGFSRGYQERFTPNEAIVDIKELEKTIGYSRLHACLRYSEGKERNYIGLKVYASEKPISLSHILPVLENMNFRVLSEIPFVINLSQGQKIWIHDFEMKTREGDCAELDSFSAYFLEAFTRIWYEEVENDGFNRLIVRANLKWQECQLIRTYAKYLRQLQITFSQTYMEDVLAGHPLICLFMIQLFACKFDPLSKEDRERAQEEILSKIKSYLEGVASLDEDRILSKFVNAITATLRTNYYQLEDGKPKSYISIKIDCKAIEEMPLPRPQYEVFVYSSRVEAIHLRGGKVARGGIRWSDRKEDFRTEVLGLMKAQMVKNAVIVPVGSKGGFVIKHPPSKEDSSTTLMSEVIFCYKTMMRGLLDLTDNIKGVEIIPPQDLVRWDEDDPYLVVAADKGTATFSDFANQISRDYDYWLDDAFASGGSSGYDHKKMGITARGAWESVKRHFREIGVDANQAEITVVGIGDMSGDVFGNGMLLSQHLKLVAAFNHLHIFIDPSPNPLTSYKERKRLFKLPHSSWIDYNPALISQGGGVFDRKAKIIDISPEIKELLGIHETKLTSIDLIRYILKASVDLLWFGGIGTFIKSSSESNNDVGDRINDSLRIEGREVRAKVIVEGANLGVTQFGRIEYAKNGGQINTDAIDNSAGVDCSDHEVNLKILFGKLIQEHKLTLETRNQLLKDMTNNVAHLVVQDNFWQNQIISLSHSQGYSLLDEQARLIRDLESEGLLNRALEGLPDEKEIARRIIDKQGLTRPELAVLLAYAKLSLNHHLIQSEFPDLDVLQPRLLSYFPEYLQKSYQKEILNHPLRREITVTLFTNSIINRMGITFVHEMRRQLGVKSIDVAKAYVIVRDLLDLISLWNNLETMETLSTSFQTDLMLIICENVKRMTDWFVRFNAKQKNIEEVISFFKPDFLILRNNLSSFFPAIQSKEYKEKSKEYQNIGLSETLTERLLTLNSLVSVPDMIILSKELQIDIKDVARVYFAIGQQFAFNWLRKTAVGLSGETQWQQEAANALIEDFYIHQRTLAKKVLIANKSFKHLFSDDGHIAEEILHGAGVESLVKDLMNTAVVDFAMMTVINRRLHLLTLES